MTTIILGTGCNPFKTTTAEAHLLEIITYLQDKELDITSNPSNKDFVQVTYNLNSMIAIGNFAIPANQSISGSGNIITTAINYLEGIDFNPGDGGTFKSLTWSEYFLEVITYLQIKEADPTKNPNSDNNVLSNYDADDKRYTGSITLPIVVTFNDLGLPVIRAKEYLL
ncbi:hypothetical protein PI95_031735 [Hassallia byssoidea VB512170]|uniref:Uncharacterized protein n=1 Tax=Hassallia byssoidea VB512170 TaxID=1304833 RepID=A0A846HHW8_9CYAN|nr:hypothetical protein [Hassalia byssoidea]NEU76946.1 hypothetical protein [Hassalia byssoidea VB512170]